MAKHEAHVLLILGWMQVLSWQFSGPFLMAKMAETGKDHGDAQAIGCGNDFFVVDRAARLDYGRGPGVGNGFKAVREGEKGIRGGYTQL